MGKSANLQMDGFRTGLGPGQARDPVILPAGFDLNLCETFTSGEETMNKQTSIGLVVLVVLALAVSVGALIEANQDGDVQIGQAEALTGTGQTDMTTLVLAEDLTVGDDAVITDDASVGGDLTVTGAAAIGSGGLYPLGYASSGYEIVCGTSGTFTETSPVSVSGLTTITHAIVTQITDPASTGAFLTVDAPSTSTLTINSWETDATVGTTGVNVYYCAVGNQ